MFLRDIKLHNVTAGFPRVRGDVPNSDYDIGVELGFSPRTRGCSVLA